MARVVRHAALCVVLSVGTTHLAAQDAAAVDSLGRGTRVLRAARPAEAIRLDGRLDDAAWRAATAATGFVQREPDPGSASTERTDAFVVLDDDALYVGMRMHEAHAGGVRAQLTRRDGSAPASDWASVMVDSYFDRRTAFKFSTTPDGVRHDVMLFEDTRADTTWDAVWAVATSRDTEGWSAEFRIPLSQLRFSAADGGATRWGLQFLREVAHSSEESFWAPVLPTDGKFVSLFGELVGPDALAPRRRAEVMPYSVGRLERFPGVAANPFYTPNATEAAFGADAKIGLTSNLTLTATLNPDFGQVEADPSVVNLGAFETFFPEKRPFFTEGAEIFRFALVPEGHVFYSRRIGRPPQRSVSAPVGGFLDRPDAAPITGAMKLSGKTANGWSVGLLGALTGEVRARLADSLGSVWTEPVEPRTTYLVARTVRDFRRGQSGVGGIATMTDRTLDDPLLDGIRSEAYTVGVNGWHRFRQARYEVTGWVLGTDVRGSAAAIAALQRSAVHRFQRPDADHLTLDTTRTALGGTAGEFFLNKIAGQHWIGAVGGGWRSPGVDVNDGGFQTFADVWYLYGRTSYRQFRPGPRLRNWTLTNEFVSARTFGDEKYRLQGTANLVATLRNFWTTALLVEVWDDVIAPLELRGGPSMRVPGYVIGQARLTTDRRRTKSAEIVVRSQYFPASEGRQFAIRPSVTAVPLPQWSFSLSGNLAWNRDPAQYLRTASFGGPRYLMGALDQTTAGLVLRTGYAVTADLAVDLYLQPFLSAGTYRAIKEVTAPQAARFDDRFTTYTPGQLTLDAATNRYEVDLDEDATVDFTFPNPDFSVRELRSNLVVRWEFRAGSTLYVVWSEARDDRTLAPGLEIGRDAGRLFGAPARDVFLVKLSYWLGR